MLVSQLLGAAWEQAKQNYYYVNRWSKDSPNVQNALEYYWNHGQLDPARVPIPAGDHYCQQLYLMGQAYYQALTEEKLLYSPPLGPAASARYLDGPLSVTKGMNGWPTVVMPCKVGDPVYAIVDGKIPHVYDYFWAYDGVCDESVSSDGLLRWGYNGVVPVDPFVRKPRRGEMIGRTTGTYLEFSCQSKVELFRAVLGR